MTNYQVEYRGLTMGLGTSFHITGLDGLEDDDVRNGDAEIPRLGGDIPGLHVPSGRDVILEVLVKGTKGSDALRADMQALIDAFQHSEDQHQLYFEEPGMGGRRYVWARPTGRSSNRDPRQPFMPKFKLRLTLADPRTYEENSNQALLQNYDAAGGGMDYDVEEYGREYTVDTSSQVTVNNAGNAKAYPILSFYGPTVGTVTQVTITNITTGEVTVHDTTILTGQTLTADMHAIITVDTGDTHPIRLGSVNRYSEWAQPRQPLWLVPGDNILRFEITGGTSTDATAALVYRDTWL